MTRTLMTKAKYTESFPKLSLGKLSFVYLPKLYT